MPNSPANLTAASTNKRVRMDPDTRAALIQRVPKAVKRTSCLPAAAMLPPVQNKNNYSGKAQKAVKHTMPQINYNNNNTGILIN